MAIEYFNNLTERDNNEVDYLMTEIYLKFLNIDRILNHLKYGKIEKGEIVFDSFQRKYIIFKVVESGEEVEEKPLDFLENVIPNFKEVKTNIWCQFLLSVEE